MAKDLTEILLRVGIIVALAIFSLEILAPFVGLVLWELIVAVTLYPMQQRLAAKLGGRQSRAATVFVLAGPLLIGLPTVSIDLIVQEQQKFQSY